jgi:hypothetical protein
MKIIETSSYRRSKRIKRAIDENLGYERDFADIKVKIENAAGTVRYGIDPDGNEWRTEFEYDYGFVTKLIGDDGDGLDVYLGPDEEAENAYSVTQVDKETGDFDELKIMLGFDSEKDAKEAYLKHYDSPDFFGGITTISMDEFKKAINGKGEKVPLTWKKKDLD